MQFKYPSSQFSLDTNQPEKVKTSSSSKSYLPKLDAVRGVAILGVFLFHFYGQTFDSHGLDWQELFQTFQTGKHPAFYTFYVFTFGWVGVSIFFVLSGFVNHWSFLNSKAFSLTEFYWKRFWRIYPPYLIALCYFAFIHRNGINTLDQFVDFVSHLFLVHNFNASYIFGFNNSFWSLAVEFQFYLLYPLVLLLRSVIGIRRTLFSALVLGIVLRVFIGVVAGPGALERFAIANFTLMVWFDWILGAYLAERYHQGKPAFNFPLPYLMGFVGLFIASTLFHSTQVISASIASFTTALVLERYINSKYTLPRLFSWLAPLGLCSYSFYLWHEPLISPTLQFLRRLGLPGGPWATMTVGSVLVLLIFFAASWCLYKTLEPFSAQVGRYLWKLNMGK